MRVVAVWSIKGGVGKTTTAAALAVLAAGEGQRTLLWDIDPQGAASHWFRVTPRGRQAPRRLARRSVPLAELVRGSDVANLDLLPADLSHRTLEGELARRRRPTSRLAAKLALLVQVYDWVLLDCAPSVTLISEAVLAAADAVLVPVVPSTLSLRTLAQLRQVQTEVGAEDVLLLPFLALVDRRRRVHRDNAAVLATNPSFLTAAIPLASVVERAAESLTPVPLAAPSSPAAAAYRLLWEQVKERLAGRPPRFPLTPRPA